MTTLDIEFENSNGNEQHLRLKDFSMRNSAAELKATLEKFTLLNLFEKDGVGLYKKLKHATIIEEIESTIFDTDDAEIAAVAVQATEEKPQVNEPVSEEAELADIYIPEDLMVATEQPEPDVLIQTIGFPAGVDLWEFNEMQSLAVVTACLPKEYALENVQVDETQGPAKLVLTGRLKEEYTEVPLATQSQPETPKKKRKRLLDRIRKRE